MSHRRSVLARSISLLAVATVSLTTACSDTLTAPTQSPQVVPKNGLVGDLVGGLTGLLLPAKALTRDAAIKQITRSFTFTRTGGKIEIPEAGLRVDIPTDAIPTNMLTITVTVLPGKSVAYDFQPHGTQFRKPLNFRQDLRGTSWAHNDFKGTL